MDAAIRAAVLALLIIAILIVVAVFLKSVYDSRSQFRVRNSAPKMREARTLPEPVKDGAQVGGGQGPSQVGSGTRGVKKIHTRLTALKVVIGAVIGTLFVKLWSMQVVSADTWRAASESNRTTTFTTQSPRGRILDRNGKVLADNRAQLSVTASKDIANDSKLVHRLSNVLGIPRAAIRQRLADSSAGAQAARVIATDVPMRAVSFISEHDSLFPGVTIETRTQRSYPYGTVGAHVVGYAGTISESELADLRLADGSSYVSGDIVGKSGAELSFESVLQGMHGSKTVETDASGNTLSELSSVEGQKGNDVRLTIDVDVQQVAETYLAEALAACKSHGSANANAGAVVALDLSDGSVLAMASAPSFDPNQFINGIPLDTWNYLNSDASNYPLTNRAISGLYPAASTFKGYASITGLEDGYIEGTSTTVDCTGTWTALGTEWSKKCWKTSGHGVLNVVDAISQSCDIYFYELSLRYYENRDKDPDALQDGIKRFGLAAETGIDLANEAVGRIPTASWKADYYRDDPSSATWLPGDMANLVIGQGDVLITPIQNAVGYSSLATGRAFRPHVLSAVLNESGGEVITYRPEVIYQPEMSDDNIAIVREGLKKQAADGGLFNNTELQAAGKSGTGQVAGKEDMGWYVGFAPADSPQYVVAACLEQAGGGGANYCTSVVRAVLSKLLGVDDYGNKLDAGTSDSVETRD